MRYGQKRKLLLITRELSLPAQAAANASLVEVNEEFRTQRQRYPVTRVRAGVQSLLRRDASSVELLTDL
jgi:hypothetical protein